MTGVEAPVREHWFQELAARWKHTSAKEVPLLLWHDTINFDTDFVVNRHNDFFSLYVVRQGRGTHVIHGLSYGVARGDVYAMGLGMAHYFTHCHDLVLDTLHFAPHIFDPPTLEALMATRGFQSLFVEEPLQRAAHHGEGGRWLHLTPDAYADVAAEIEELRTEWNSGTPSGIVLTRALFTRLLVHLARRYAQCEEPSIRSTLSAGVHEGTVAAAVRYMDAHFSDPLRIDQIAAQVFLSPDRFTEVFTQAMGRTPRDYLRHVRVEWAKRLLTTTTASVAEVGMRAGFGEPAYFTRAFRAATGMTPTDFRRQ